MDDRHSRPTALHSTTLVPLACANCELAIRGRPTFHVGLAFCCAGCVADGPCQCSYDEPLSQSAVPSFHECLDVTVFADGPEFDREPERELVHSRG